MSKFINRLEENFLVIVAGLGALVCTIAGDHEAARFYMIMLILCVILRDQAEIRSMLKKLLADKEKIDGRG